MGISSIQHNMLMANADRRMKENAKVKTKSAERLASGYKVNRAADDAAGLSMSEKMRFMIRGLQQGTANVMDGISWVQIGDGSLEEAHSMLHRMTELAIKSSNGTCTDDDRAMMQAEFAHLQKEIDRLTDNTTFNEQHIFQEHEWPYHEIEGSTYWPPRAYHTVREGENDLVITYARNEKDPLETVSIKVAAGEYTTKELVDEIDTALEEAGLLEKGIRFTYTDRGFCNLDLEGGRILDDVSGGLSYLLFDNFGGGTLGALIGTTVYGGGALTITGQNDKIEFEVLDAEGNKVDDINFSLPHKPHTKKMIMDALQNHFDSHPNIGAGKIKVEEYGTSIKISSPDYIITKFKGNMFKIDDDTDSLTGVFYDNVHYANIIPEAGTFTGGYVLQDSAYSDSDPERSVFHIEKGVNDRLVLNPNGKGEMVIDLTNVNGKNMNGSTIYEMATALNSVLKSKGINVKVSASYDYASVKNINGTGYSSRIYRRLEFTTDDKGPGAKVGIDKGKSTAYNTLFTSRERPISYDMAEFGGNDGTVDENARVDGDANIADIKIEKDKNDEFSIQISSRELVDGAWKETGEWVTVKVNEGTYATASDLASAIQSSLPADRKWMDSVTVSSQGGKIRIEANKAEITKIRIESVTDNLGYRDIFQGVDYIPDREPKSGASSVITLNPVKAGTTERHPNAAKMNDDGTVTIDPKYGNLVVYIDGEARSVNLAAKSGVSRTELAAYITENLKPYDKDIGCTQYAYPDQSAATYTNSVTVKSSTDGGYSSNASTQSCYSQQRGKTTYKTGGTQGEASEFDVNEGAELKFGKKLENPIKITADNSHFKFYLNQNDNTYGSKKTVDINLLTELGKTEFASSDEFVTALQAAIKTKLGKNPEEFGGVKVELDNGYLKLTAGIDFDGAEVAGKDFTSLQMDTGKGTFVWDLHKYPTPASVTIGGTSREANYSFKTKGEPELKLKLTKPGGAEETISVKLKKDSTYGNINALIGDLNSTDKLQKYGIEASWEYDSNYNRVLKFKTTDGGDGYKLTVDTNCEAMKYFFGYEQEGDNGYDLKQELAYKMHTNEKVVSDPITIGSSLDERKFTLNIDGTDKTVYLAAGTYSSRDAIAEAIQNAFGASVVKVTVNKNGQLTFEHGTKGAGHSLSISYDANSAMKKIFGTKHLAGVEAEISVDGKLTLKRVGGEPGSTGTVAVVSHQDYNNVKDVYQGGSFIFEKDTDYSNPDYYDGHHSAMNSYMDGVDLKLNSNGNVDIEPWNNEMTFYYAEDYRVISDRQYASAKKIDITLNPKEGGYSMEDLRAAIQEQIDNQTGVAPGDAQKMIVSVTKQGVRIEAAKTGSRYRIFQPGDRVYPYGSGSYNNLSPVGSFYEKVMCRAKTTKDTLYESYKDGTQNGNQVYVVGRQDVRNEQVKIQKDGNDKLSLELYTPSGKIDLEMVLDPNYYQGDELTKQIQKQLDKALVDKGLPAGLIEVGIGLVDTGITGSADADALTFRLSDKVKVPDSLGLGEYRVEAVGGTAAFSIFYATDGDIARAYVRGGQDISKGVEIKPGKTGLSVDVDGITYKIELDPGKYTTQELLDHINEKFENAEDGAVPLRAYEDGGRLKLMHKKYGLHKINHLSGSVKNQLFFREKGEWSGRQPMRLRASGVSGDWIEVDKPWMDTTSLGINTLTIEKFKNAQKAITRLKQAVTKVSEVRSYFGAMQNRLESTVRNNMNKTENTTAAESRIRDADFADEAVKNSIHNILEQSGVSVMTQIMQNSNLALQLLQ